jgi:hypothetical protein
MIPRLVVSRITKPYWERIPEEERTAIVAAIPDGMSLVLYPGHHAKPGTTTVSLRTADRNMLLQEERGTGLASMCRTVLGREARARG